MAHIHVELPEKERGVVGSGDWNFIGIDDVERDRWLAEPPQPSTLIDLVVAEACEVVISRDPHRATSAVRVRVTFEVSPRTFDQLFHGRSRYRAQYYLSPQAGRAYNRQLVDALIPVVEAAFERLEQKPMTWGEIERSLAARESKVWPAADSLLFSRAGGNSRLSVLRWERYWRERKPKREASGLFANLPSPPLIMLKGTFFNGDELQPSAKDRDRELHETGYT